MGPSREAVQLPPAWERHQQRDGSWLYKVQRLPLGWISRYSTNGFHFFHDTFRHLCTRDDPRAWTSPSNGLRKSSTQEVITGPPSRSSTISKAFDVFDVFKHSHLSTPSTIRLLKWLGREDSGIPTFSVEEFEIEQAPAFVALSYTWGNPFSQASPGNDAYSADFQWPILCDGKVMLVTRNLYEFLQLNDPEYDDSNDAVGGGSALHYAAHRGRFETVSDLLEIGAEINCRDAMGRTPLFLACFAQHVDVVEFLLSRGADTALEAHTDAFANYSTPLHLAVAMNNIALAEALVEAGASIEARLKNGLTAMHHAVWRKSAEMTGFLLSKGANTETKAINAETGQAPLLTAADNVDMDCIKLLVKHGASLDAIDDTGRTALHKVVEEEDIDMVNYLLQEGANPFIATTAKGWTVLHAASAHGRPEVVLELLNKGAHVERTEKEGGRNSLLLAAEFNRLENLRILLDRGASVKARRSDGCTSLHMASWRQSALMVKELLSRGADVHAVNTEGQTPLHKASGQPAVTKRDDLYDLVLMEAVAADRIRVIQTLLEHGADVNAVDESYITPLHCSASSGSSCTAALLLDSGACVNRTTNIGNTPLISATASNNTAMLRLLIDRGAKIDHQTKSGKTALHIAICSGHADIAIALVESGANVNVADEDGDTPLHEAAYHNSSHLYKMLLDSGANINTKNKQSLTPPNIVDWKKEKHSASIPASNSNDQLAENGTLSGMKVDKTTLPSASEQQPSGFESVDEPCLFLRPGTTSGVVNSSTLHSERRRKKLKYVWIDACSINQADEIEKRAQVNLMSRIYSRAALVHVWLGLEDKTTGLAAQTIRKIVALHATKYKGFESNYDPDLTMYWHLKNERHTPREISVMIDDTTIEIPTEKYQFLINVTEWDSFASLIQRPWFQRIWIVQELARAKHVQMSCGVQNIVWEDLYRALVILTPIRDAFANGPQIWKRISTGTAAFVGAEIRSRLQPSDDYALDSMKTIITWSQTSRLPLAALLLLTWHFQATDPRDKIYALLGLAKDWNESHTIQPDYQRQTVDVYIMITKILLEGFAPIDDARENIVEVSRADIPELEPLEILSFACHGSSLPYSHLPSWVPDFVTSLHGPRLWYKGYGPADPLPAKWSFPRPSILRTHGVPLESVAEIEKSPRELPADDLNRFIYWLAILPEELDDQSFSVLFNSLTVFHSNSRFRFPGSMSRTAFVSFLYFCAQRRILYESGPEVSSNECNLLDWHGNWDRFAESTYTSEHPHLPFPTIAELEDELRDPSIRLLNLHKSTAELYAEFRPFISPLINFLSKRYLFRAQASGHMGILPKSAEAGDCIVAIGGAATLFVIRRAREKPEEWKIIGEAFMPWHAEVTKARDFDFL